MTKIMTMILVVMALVCSEADTLSGESGYNGSYHNSTHHIYGSSFVRFLFRKYGRDEVMTFEGLEHLLDNLGLGHVTSFGHALQSHIDEEGNFMEFHEDHQHANELIADNRPSNIDINHGEEIISEIENSSTQTDRRHNVDAFVSMIEITKERLNSADANISCLSAKEIMRTFHIKYDGGIHTSQFLTLCPALVYQLDRHLCQPKPSNKYLPINNETLRTPISSWLGALGAVGTISLAGLIIVGIIPWVANCSFYDNIIQFLISLAVGTLTADALLHLLPHAMIPHDSSPHKEDRHDKHSVYVGLVTFSAMLLFFIVERILKMFLQNKTKSHRHDELKNIEKNNSMALLEMSNLKNNTGVEFNKDGISSIEKLTEISIINNRNTLQDGMNDDRAEHLARDHHHHHHGHSHVVPSSIASVAWMVIMGDGLHNFTDGLAIGASFSSSITIGLSTSVAVLCHELPHELGDFAVLLKSGMSMRQAITCNILSSILCFFGACLGVAIGNMDSFTSWIFSITAGIFIYIALVDMLPQVTSMYDSKGYDDMINNGIECANHIKNNRLFYLIIHTIGIISGMSLMLIIALFEDSISINIY